MSRSKDADKIADKIAELEAEIARLTQENTQLKRDLEPCYEARVWSKEYQCDLSIPAKLNNCNRLARLVAELAYEERMGIKHQERRSSDSAGILLGVNMDLTNVVGIVNCVVAHIEMGHAEEGAAVKWHNALDKQRRPALD